MTPAAILIATVTLLFTSTLAAALIDRWAHRRRRMLDRAFGNDDTRAIDILKRGEICPWPRDV